MEEAHEQELHTLEHGVKALLLVVAAKRNGTSMDMRVKHDHTDDEGRSSAPILPRSVGDVAFILIRRPGRTTGSMPNSLLHRNQPPKPRLKRSDPSRLLRPRSMLDFSEQGEDGKEHGIRYEVRRVEHGFVLRAHRRPNGRLRRVQVLRAHAARASTRVDPRGRSETAEVIENGDDVRRINRNVPIEHPGPFSQATAASISAARLRTLAKGGEAVTLPEGSRRQATQRTVVQHLVGRTHTTRNEPDGLIDSPHAS